MHGLAGVNSFWITVRLLCETSAQLDSFQHLGYDLSSYYPEANASRVSLAIKETWPQRRCLIVYAPMKCMSRAIEHWAIRFGYSVGYLAYWRAPRRPLISGSLNSQVFIGHADIVSVRQAFALRGIRCLEWAHLRDPRARLFSHLAHLRNEGWLGDVKESMKNLNSTLAFVKNGIDYRNPSVR